MNEEHRISSLGFDAAVARQLQFLSESVRFPDPYEFLVHHILTLKGT